jgi:hypothetical protein
MCDVVMYAIMCDIIDDLNDVLVTAALEHPLLAAEEAQEGEGSYEFMSQMGKAELEGATDSLEHDNNKQVPFLLAFHKYILLPCFLKLSFLLNSSQK